MGTKSEIRNRIVAVKTIDDLFYEKRNVKRCHRRAYELYTYPLYGICEETNSNYLKRPDSLKKLFPLPEHLECMLRLDIRLVKNMPPVEAAKVLNRIYLVTDRAIERMKSDRKPLNAETLMKYLSASEKMPAGDE